MSANPFSGIITPQLKQTFDYAIQALLETSALVVPCRFNYGDTKFTTCPNCIGNKDGRSANKYNGTGPSSFDNGQICPVCAGVYRIPVNTNEIVPVMVIWNSNNWLKLPSNIENPTAFVATFSNMSEYNKLKQVKNILFDVDIEGNYNSTYQRHGELTPIGFGKDSFIMGQWKKI